ncbi:MAG: hypothetical protein J6R77_00670 [Clostridia bacterium]|nr:hypothetical protein [Clostridia bacterium]
MKKVLALLLCLLFLVPTAALPTFVASADIEGRVIQEFTIKGAASKTLTGDGYVCAPSSYLKEAVDLSGYALNDLAFELDLYLEGDLTAFQSNINAWLELTSSGKADDQEINWDIGKLTWQSDKWFRLTLKLSEAGKGSSTAIDLSKVNYARMYVYSAGGVNQQYTFKYCNFRLVDLSKGAEGTDPIGDGTFKVNPPEWELVDTEYPTTEAIIAGYNLGDYIQPNSGVDATGALQTLLNAMGANGGGTVFVPAGRWVFKGSLEIPYGVTLQGDWRAPTDENPEAVGTIFEVYGGKGSTSGASFIVQLPNSCVQGITFWYPEQDPENIVPYPMTIQKYKAGNWGADYTHVRNCTFINAYSAVQQPAGSGCPNVYNVYGTPLYLGVFMDNVADIGRIDYIYFGAKYWENCGLPGAPTTDTAKKAVRDYIYNNATALKMGRVDWSYWCFSEIEGYQNGMHFINSPADPGAYANGHVYGMTFTDCETAIRVDGCSTGAAEIFSNITIKDCKTGILTVNDQQSIGNLNMSYVTIDADVAIKHDGNMRFMINTFDIQRGTVEASRGPLMMSGSTFHTAAPHIELKNGANSVILQGNKAANGEFTVSNPSKCPVRISNKAVEMKDIEWMTGDQSKDKTVKAAREVLYVADFDNTGKTVVTSKLQALLDKAGQEGGGYVFLPGGHYRLDKGVTVPSGVELVGATDIGRNPYQIGTILDVVGMRGDATITLSANSGIRAIVFDYPEQGNSPEKLKTYPVAIQGRGENVHIVNVAIRNGYDGVDLMSYRCDNHYIKYLAGYCFHSVLKVGGGSVGGKIINYQMNSSAWWSGYESKYGSWKNSPSTKDHTEGTGGAWRLNNIYVQSNCVILTVGDVTDQVLYNNFSYLGAVGVYFVEENGQAADGWNVGNAYDYTSVGIKVDAIEKMDFINPQIVSYNYTGEVPNTHHMYLTDKCDDVVNIVNVACWAQPDSYIRADGGTINVYCGSYTDNAKSACFATIGEKGKINLQNGAISNRGVKSLATSNLQNLSVEGYINEHTLNGESEALWGTNMVRGSRWDLPQNATIDATQNLIFTEGFTDHRTDRVEGVSNALAANGYFNVFNPMNANTNVTRADVDGNHMMRLYHNGASQSVFARNSTLRLKSGAANNLYMMEFRVNVKSLRDTFALSVYNIANSLPSGTVDLLTFKADGVYAGQEKLTDKSLDTWYRVQITFDLRDGDHKTYTIRLLDDEYKLIAEMADEAAALFPENYQDAANDIGMLSLSASAERTEDDKITEVLVDYLFVTQDPTVIRDEEPKGMLGDVDGDEKITSTDARLTLQFYAGKITEKDLDLTVADVDGDEKITSTDARLILQYYAGKIEDFPI